MDCILFIPHLIPPHELGAAFWRTVDAPQLKSMLARAALTADATVDADAWLCRTFGIARQEDFPLATQGSSLSQRRGQVFHYDKSKACFSRHTTPPPHA